MLRTFLLTSVIISVAAAGALAQESPDQKIFIYAEITGGSHGMISEGASSEESIGHFANETHKDEITVLGFSDEMWRDYSFDPTNKAITVGIFYWKPFTLLKYIDKTTPLLESCLHDGYGRLIVTVSFYQLNPDNEELELVMTKKFDPCYVSKIKKNISNPEERTFQDIPVTEEVMFFSRRVTTTHSKTGISNTIDLDPGR